MQAIPAIAKAKADGKDMSQIYNPDSSDYVGKTISTFKRPMSQWISDQMQETSNQPTAQSLVADYYKDVQSGIRQADAKAKLESRMRQFNLLKENKAPQVPVAQ